MTSIMRVDDDDPGRHVAVGPDTDLDLVSRLLDEGIITKDCAGFGIGKGMRVAYSSERLLLAWAFYSPDWLLEAIREVMGGIDVDPASCKLAQKRIKAGIFYDSYSNGLEQPWIGGRVFLNSSYSQPMLNLFIEKMMAEWELRNFKEIIIHVHTGKTQEDWFQTVMRFGSAFCFVRGCIEWVPSWLGYEDDLAELGFDLSLTPGHTEHGSLVAYRGPHPETFKRVFGEFGSILQQKT